MKIEIDPQSGFCFGVVNAIRRAEEALAAGEVCSLGDIVHNRMEVSRLENLGLKTVGHGDLPRLAGKTVLIRAHGEPPSTYEAARAHGVRLVDATCPVVARLQQRVREASREMAAVGGQVVILGKRGHAEVVGLAGAADGRAVIVEGPDELDVLDLSRPLYLLSQTTQSLDTFEKVQAEILHRAADPGQVRIHDSICRSVSNREAQLRKFSREHDVTIFVSGRKSSNGAALFEACAASNPRSHKIEEPAELRAEWFAGASTVGICGATSTPDWLMEQVARRVGAMA